VEIIKVGTFDEEGMGNGWHIDCKGAVAVNIILDLPANGDVLIGGVLMRELTEERRLKMGKNDYRMAGAIRMLWCRLFHKEHSSEELFRFGSVYRCSMCKVQRYIDDFYS